MFKLFESLSKLILGQTMFVSDDEGGTGQDDTSGQGESGNLDVVADIDFSDIEDEKVREAVRAKTAEKARKFQSGLTKRQQELADMRKKVEAKEKNLDGWGIIKGEYESDPLLKDSLDNVYRNYKSGTLTKKEKVEVSDNIDSMIEKTSDPQAKEDLRTLKKFIENGSGSKELRQEISLLKDQIRNISISTRSVNLDRVDREITNLESKFGEVVDKYKDDVRDLSLKNPNLSVNKIFLSVADDKDLETAYAFAGKNNQRKKEQLKNLDPKGKSIVTEHQYARTKSGKVESKSLAGRVMERFKSEK